MSPVGRAATTLVASAPRLARSLAVPARTDSHRSDEIKGVGLSLLAHAALFALGTWLWVQPVNYGVTLGESAVEIELLAAPAALPVTPVDAAVALPEPPAVVQPEAPTSIEPAEPASTKDESEKVEIKKAEPARPSPNPTGPVGDGSSPVPGTHAVTQRASAGAQIAARPNYLKNPAPRYPEISRRRGEEGVVVLTAHVDRAGKPSQIELFRSSGHRDLDASALASVKRWVFEPAHVGPLVVESTVQIPVRFRLSDRS